MCKSRIEPDDNVRVLSTRVEELSDRPFHPGPDVARTIQRVIRRGLKEGVIVRELSSVDDPEEERIRHRRTAGQILVDNYVYQERACVDWVTLFQSVCVALGIESQFVYLFYESGDYKRRLHGIVQFQRADRWFHFDPSSDFDPVPLLRPLRPGDELPPGTLRWMMVRSVARDSWAAGVDSAESTKVFGQELQALRRG